MSEDADRLLEDFYAWMLTEGNRGQPMALSTAQKYRRDARRGVRSFGIDVEAWKKDEEQAHSMGRAWIVHEREYGTSGSVRNAILVLNALARWAGHDIRWKAPRLTAPEKQRYSAQEVRAMMAYRCDDQERERRTRALLQFHITTGLRRGEIAEMEDQDMDPDHNRVHVRVPYKGGKRRWIPVPGELFSDRRPFMAWLNSRPIVEGDEGAIFTASRPTPHRMTSAALYNQVKKVSDELGFTINFNRARHTRGTMLHRAGADLRYVQLYLGHRNIESTNTYVETDEADLDELFRSLTVPGPWQGDEHDTEQ